MRGFLFYAVLYALVPFSAAAAGNDEAGSEPAAAETVERLDSAIVSVSRAGEKTPVTFTMVGKDVLRASNPMFSMPMTLNLQPSVIAVNEGGTGIGASKMTIRGSKGPQINVTLNGITLNDAESQEVFWVNIPALSNILSSVQLQRGLGTSANGPGAFGASVNMSTSGVAPDPYAGVDVAAGSYNSFMTTASAGTGLTRSGLYFDFSYSRNTTDGYIRNAKAKTQSAYAALGWMKGSNSLRFTYLMGDQHTGITWNGISLEQYEKDRTYNDTGSYEDAYGNVFYYDNDTDNYTQHHFQLNYTHQFGSSLVWSTTLNYTRGDGYYENYKDNKDLADYKFQYFTDPGTGAVVSEGDLIVRKLMANDYYVVNSDLRYVTDKLNLTAGLNLSRYDGDHFGEVLWCDVYGEDYDYENHDWYFNNGLKQEVNVFARAEYSPVSWLTAYADVQYRGIFLDMDGFDDDDDVSLAYRTDWHFVNPRLGLTFNWSPSHKAYVSAAVASREPARSDIKESIKTWNESGEEVRIKPETMLDVEIGYSYSSRNFSAAANLYFMEYKDMLLATGKLTNTGRPIQENVSRSYRRGLELQAGWTPAAWMRVDANATLSLNKILDYVDYVEYYDSEETWAPLGVKAIDYGKTDMLMSPSIMGMLQLSFYPFRTFAANSLKTTALSINGKYVGKQYIDNTSREDRSIPAYFVSNLSISHEFDIKGGKLGIAGYVNNLFNNMYYADGWIYKAYFEKEGKEYQEIGIFPQAPVNFMLKLSYRF